ncbi:D-glycerate dehydrogenase [Qingshengfaniella alkalisoli]|uniref:D-glycerate dehydrogenase n=1 Tax=Qingshengfaniella alkalisoli TaxID=2599296 RepID=A0A5B8I8T1_9RHOB|nr:D-glycerate dehydrogenase [Qingshengfaniella alkalisoli]
MTRPLPDKVLEKASEHFEAVMRPSTTPLSDEELTGALMDFDAVLPTLGDLFSADVFDAVGGHCRAQILANFGVGYNHIDVHAARAVRVEVTNTPGAVTDATADIALTLMLMASRRAGEGERLVRSGDWEGWHPTQMLGQHVTGKTLGVVGMGRIGKAIAKRAHHGFDMDVVFFNRSTVEDAGVPARQLETLEGVAKTADFVVVSVPGGADTHHLIDAKMFSAMKATGVFVNISRGDVVDEKALVSALKKGKIASAGLDVYENEPEVPQALMGMENVVLLPHLGTAALEVREQMGLMAVDNLIAFFEGKAPPNAV